MILRFFGPDDRIRVCCRGWCIDSHPPTGTKTRDRERRNDGGNDRVWTGTYVGIKLYVRYLDRNIRWYQVIRPVLYERDDLDRKLPDIDEKLERQLVAVREQHLSHQKEHEKSRTRLNISESTLQDVKRLDTKVSRMDVEVHIRLYDSMITHSTRLVDFNNESLHLLNRFHPNTELDVTVFRDFFTRYDFKGLRFEHEDKPSWCTHVCVHKCWW